MNRRDFIERTSMISAAALLPSINTSCMAPPKYKMGYQLYSIRDEMAKDPLATLKALKAMGYEDFETYGYDTDQDTFYGYKSADFNKVLEDLEITVTSGHYGFAPFLDSNEKSLERFVDQCIIGAKAVNSNYITWPWIAPEQRTLENFKRMPAMLNKIGEQVVASGLGFAYHNHGFEFEDHDGQMGIDIIINETDPELVKLQVDMYWVMHAGKTTPKKMIDAQPGRYVMWHIKDMDKVSRDYSELGNGSIDYLDILPDPIKSGLEFSYIEQGGNYATNSLQSAADSAAYYKKNLSKLL